ncbi:MAG: MFS transporter [Hyphomicrobiales bacterium]
MSNSTTALSFYRSNTMFRFLLFITIATAIGFQGWRTFFNNFAVDEVGLNGFYIGAIQSFREVPGFLVFSVIFVLLFIGEVQLILLASAFMGIGILFTGMFPTFIGLMGTTFLMSLGFHYFETTTQSLVLQNYNRQDSPHILATLRSTVAVTNIIIGTFIFLFGEYSSFQTNYILLGLAVLAMVSFALFQKPTRSSLIPQQKRMVIKRKYWLFYVLNLLSGARRQVFVVFSILLLVEKYNVSIVNVSLLFILNNVISIIVNPLIAKAINRFGEKKMLTFEYMSLALIFLAYATIENVWVVASLYVLDHIFFNFSIGIKTYFQKHADPEDIAPSMAVGFTVNHIVAVILPVIGGFLWLSNWHLPFYGAVMLCIISLVFVQFMKPKETK